MIMKIKSSVLFGLIVVIFSVSGFSLLKRLTQDVDEWRPSDLYSTTNVSRRSTYSVVSSGASASYSGAAPSVSSGASSMFRHRGVSSYAPASAPAYSQLPLASSPLASSPQGGLYATSSAEFRSFGGGGNAGGVSMSGGTVKSSGSSVALASGLSVSMPSTSMYAFAGQNQSVNIPIVSGDAAIASVASASSYSTAYNGIGCAVGGVSKGLGGRKNLGIDDSNVEDSWLNWLALMGINLEDFGGVYDESTNTWSYDFDVYELKRLYEAYCNGWNFTMGKKPTWDEWLAWFMGSEGDPYMWDDGGGEKYGFSFVPVGDYTPLLVLALLYVAFVAYRRRQRSNANCEK